MATASIHILPECSICCEQYKTPKVLQCGHTYCLDCIQRYIGDKKETFLCPICGQIVKIPEGGAKMFITIFALQTTTHGVNGSTTQSHVSNILGTPTSHTTEVSTLSVSPVNHDCPYHKRPVDYYCISCHSLICPKCFIKDHQGHEYLDIEGETTKERAKELISSSEKFIQNKIKELEETHTSFVEASKKLLSYTEDACRRISQQTEKIITDIKTSSETAMLDIRNKFKESECILTGARDNIMEQMKNVKLDLETNLPSLSQDSCVQILASIPKIKELEKLCESMKDNSPVLYEYMDWEERNFSLDLGMLGSVVKKSCYLDMSGSVVTKSCYLGMSASDTPTSQTTKVSANKQNCFRFRFDIDKIDCYSKDKFSSNGITWTCYVWWSIGYINISIKISSADNPRQDCSIIIDGQLSLLNNDDRSKTLTKSLSNEKLTTGGPNCVWTNCIYWNELFNKNNGYLTSNNQFIVQLDIKQIRDRVNYK